MPNRDPQAKEKADQEAKLDASLAVIFMKFNKEFRQLMSYEGRSPSSVFSLDDTKAALEKRYSIIQKQFKDKALNGFSFDDFENAQAYFDEKLEEWKMQTAAERARIISNTNAAQAEQARNEAIQLLAADNQPITNRNIAALASAVLSRKFKARRKFIAQTEIQAAYESTKFLKGQTIMEIPEIRENHLVIDTWNSVLDGNERLSHNEADGQSRMSPEPFEVGGALLRFPGDPEGPLAEIINCRCYLTTKVEKR